MKTNYTGSCVDHTLELASEDSIAQCGDMKCSLKKLRNLVNYFKDVATAREAFKNIMINARVEPMTILQGTSNRWFFKYSEAHQALILKDHITTFFEDFDIPDSLDRIEEEDWEMILVYENAMKYIVQAAKVFEGELYPTASSVIPFLDAVFLDLSTLVNNIEGGAKVFVNTLLSNLKSSRRFPNGYKDIVPYNCLTLLDIRYADIYFTKDEYHKAVQDLRLAKVYDADYLQGSNQAVASTSIIADSASDQNCNIRNDCFSKRR